MAKRLRLSDDVAGATLMALGNGAPDVFTAWNAIQNAADFPLVLAELLGASIFITTVVLGVVILAAHGRARARRLDLQAGADGDEAPCQVDARPFARDVSVLGLSIFAISCCALDRSIDVTESAALLGLYACYVLAIVYAQRGDKDAGSDDERDRVAAAPLLAAGDAPGGLRLRGVHWGESPSAWDRVVHVAEWPFSAARHASIPPATFDDWSEGRRRLAACAVAGAVVVVVLDFGSGGDARTALVALGFLATVAWLDLLASETVAVLESLGAAAGLSSAVLGVTALAWGNCIGDLVADGAVARAGHARMAVASVFNSPLFSQINALGVPVAYYCYFHGPLRIALDPQAVLSFAVVAASILATALVARANDGALPRHHAFTLFGLYAAYVAAAVAVELHRVSS
ncbi:Wnt/PCP co-receptor [Aureococcus anophagefferens]|uniref:Wnt/PCP co-receptor n=1 Tax=Aureococcus anophagefferens TaxID=44056 RepID=A0ABR1G324_AURAN